MKHDIEQIRELCGTFCKEPKLLLIPGRGMKRQVLKALTDHGIDPLNLDVKTIKELSLSIARDSIRHKFNETNKYLQFLQVFNKMNKKLQRRH